MAKSKIVVTFNIIPQVLDVLAILNGILPSGQVLAETFFTIRDSNGKTKIGLSITESAYNYYLAVQTDYNNSSNYTITYLSNTVTIEAKESNVVFSILENNTSGRISTLITNEVEAIPITIDSVTYSQADSDACNYVKVNVTTSELATSISSPIVVDPNIDNPFSFDYLRGTNIQLSCTNGVTTANGVYTLPGILAIGNVDVVLFNTPTGSNATINVSNVGGLTLQYSLDNTTWKSQNTFNGLVEDTYTIYVKDQLGCTVSKSFEVVVFTPDIELNSAFSYLANEMSIRFKKNIAWDNFSDYKNEDNTLSCEEDKSYFGKNYKYYHKFQTVDIIETQFLSNYSDISANIIKEDGSKVALTINEKVNNIGVKDYRDATYYKYSDTQIGVYFTSGNTYDYVTGLVNGTYVLNGLLPDWGVIGNYIEISTLGWFSISEIIYDEALNHDVLLINYAYSGAAVIEKVGSIFNYKNYNVYDFEINFFDYLNEDVQIEILQNDINFGDYNYLSETISVSNYWDNTIELKWYNDTDSFVYYSTGIINKSRFDFEKFDSESDSELEIHKTDTTAILISSESYKSKVLEFSPVTTSIMEQIKKALLHKELYINNVQYVSNSSPETEIIPNTNLYIVRAKLTKTGNVFNSEYSTDSDVVSGEIIGLLQSDDNYIKLG